MHRRTYVLRVGHASPRTECRHRRATATTVRTLRPISAHRGLRHQRQQARKAALLLSIVCRRLRARTLRAESGRLPCASAIAATHRPRKGACAHRGVPRRASLRRMWRTRSSRPRLRPSRRADEAGRCLETGECRSVRRPATRGREMRRAMRELPSVSHRTPVRLVDSRLRKVGVGDHLGVITS